MDIYPQSIANMLREDLIRHMCDTMEQTMGDQMLAEFCIRTFDKISLENPHAVLTSKAIALCLGMIDFFDASAQAKILTLLFNCCRSAQSEEEFNQHFMNMVPQLCPMLQVHTEADQARAEKVSAIFSRMTESFAYFYSPAQNFEKIGKLWEKFAETGAVNCIVECLREHAQCIEATQQPIPAGNAEAMDFEMINTQGVNPLLALQKKSYTDGTLSNFFKLLALGSRYSLLVTGTIVNGEGIESFEKLLPREDQQAGYTLELTVLLN